MEEEIWKDIPGYVGFYQASNLGRVKSLDRTLEYRNRFCLGTILKPTIDHHGYELVYISKNGKRGTTNVHRLIAMAFLGLVPNGHEIVVDHIDGNKKYNNVLNLRLVSNRENCAIRHRIDKEKASSRYPGAYYSKDKRKWAAAIQINGKTKNIGRFKDEIDAANAYIIEYNKLEINKLPCYT